MTTRVYPDSNAIAYCQSPFTGWTPKGAACVREALGNAVQCGEIIVLGSQFHLEEASRIPGIGRREFFNVFWDVVQWNLLLPTSELVVEEARVGRPLSGNEPFDEYRRRQALRRWCRDDGKLDGLAKAVEGFVTTFAEDHEKRRESAKSRFVQEYMGLSIKDATDKWWSKAESQVDDWVRDYIRASRQHLDLSADEGTWPKPRDLQTAWAIHAYHMARIVMNVGLGRRIDDGDAHDAHHYAGACYADVLVTDDKAFRDTLDIVPRRHVKVITFNQFARRLGVRVG